MENMYTKISKKTPKTLRPVDKNESQLVTSLKKTPVVLDKTKKVTIGCSAQSIIRIPMGTVSALHASVKWEKSAYILKDERSTNGTYLNEKRINAPARLKKGDKIKIGKYVITYKEKVIRVKVKKAPAKKAPAKKAKPKKK